MEEQNSDYTHAAILRRMQEICGERPKFWCERQVMLGPTVSGIESVAVTQPFNRRS
jgi:hypothetical protein